MERYTAQHMYIYFFFGLFDIEFVITNLFSFNFACTENQAKAQAEKQEQAQQRREESLVQKKIENAHREMERLEKYVNISDG